MTLMTERAVALGFPVDAAPVEQEEQFVVLGYGYPGGSFSLYGPFVGREAATAWVEEIGPAGWSIRPVEPPFHYDEDAA